MNREQQRESFGPVEKDVRAGITAIGFVPNEQGQRSDDTDSGMSAFGWGPPFDFDEESQIEVDVVPWTFVCRHDGVVDERDPEEDDEEKVKQLGIFEGLFPTGREVTIRGVTFVDRSGSTPKFYRYVDWADALTQLGCTVSQRVLVNEKEYLDGLKKLREPSTDS